MATTHQTCLIILAVSLISVLCMPFEDKVHLSTHKNKTRNKVTLHTKERTDGEDGDMFLLLEAGAEVKKEENNNNDDEDEKTLSQQIADGKYGLIQKEIYSTIPSRPGIISYNSNPEVPDDTADNLGGLHSNEIWLAEDHVLVLRGGQFPNQKTNITYESITVWPPIDDYKAPLRQVKIPPNPKVPPPFPVQLKEGGPAQLIGPNGTAIPVPGNGSYFVPPFESYPPLFFPPPENFTNNFPNFPFPPPGNFTRGGEFFSPVINGSLPFPLPPFPPSNQRNGSLFIPFFPGNVSTGNGPFYPPPFPGVPFPPLARNGSLPFFPPLPPGATFLPPPDNLTDLYDEDDPSIFYPPPYDFYYPTDNSTQVPPGPLVPGIILPPPPNFFGPLANTTQKNRTMTKPVTKRPSTGHPRITTTTTTKPLAPKKPALEYLPPTRRKKPRPQVEAAPEVNLNEITPTEPPAIVPLTTPQPADVIRPINVNPSKVEITHGGQSPLNSPSYYKDDISYINLVTPPPSQPYVTPTYNSIIYPTAITYQVSPVTDILVSSKSPTRVKKPKTAPPPVYVPGPPQYNPNPVTFQKPIYVLEYQSNPDIQVPYDKGSFVPSYYNPNREVPSDANIKYPSRPRYQFNYQGSVTPAPPQTPTTKTSYYFYEEPQIGNAYISNSGSSQTPKPLQYYNQQQQQPYYNNGGKIDISQLTPQERYILSQIILGGRTGYVYNRPNTTPAPKFYYNTVKPQYNNPVPKYYIQQEQFYSTPRPLPDVPPRRPHYNNLNAGPATRRPLPPFSHEIYNTQQPLPDYDDYYSPLAYRSTPKPVLYAASTARPNLASHYPTDKAQYTRENTIPSSTLRYNTKQRNREKTQDGDLRLSKIREETTPNPLDIHYTKQDEALLDDITKKYFTIFGQKIHSSDSSKSTTPIPPQDKPFKLQEQIVNGEPPTSGSQYKASENFQSDINPNSPHVSLEKDTDVNFKEPLPPINPDSEYVVPTNNHRASDGAGSLITYQLPGNGNGHVYFLTPQIVNQPQQQQNGYVYVTPPEQRRLHYRRNRKRNSR